MRLCVEFLKEGQELPPPTFFEEDKDPSKAQPQWSRTLISMKIGGRGMQSSRRVCPSINEVGESHHASKPMQNREEPNKLSMKRHRYERSQNIPDGLRTSRKLGQSKLVRLPSGSMG